MSEGSSPPMSPSQQSLTSNMMTPKQYLFVNISKAIVEFTGTAVLGIFYLSVGAQQTGILLGYWIIALFGVAISGAHYNPCITLAAMLRRNSTFGTRRLRGFIYIAAQLAGGIAAATLARFILLNEKNASNIAISPVYEYEWSNSTTPYSQFAQPLDSSRKFFSSYISEAVGTFLFVFMIMICTEKKTQFSEDKVINCFIMAASYVAARLFAGGQLVTALYKEGPGIYRLIPKENGGGYAEHVVKLGPLLNPALAFGQMMLSLQFENVQYVLMPLAGAAGALVFYEFVFVKS